MAQMSFDPLDYAPEGDKTAAQMAKAARDRCYREFKANGSRVTRWVCKNQLQKYAGFGQPDGRVRDVYMLNIDPPADS